MALAAIALALPMAARGATVQSASANDYASNDLGYNWDMDAATDISFELTRDTGNITNLRFEDGKLKATAKDLGGGIGDARITVKSPTDPYTNPVAPDGHYKPINADKYRYLIARVYSPVASQAQVVWNRGPGTTFNTSKAVAVQANAWTTVTIDMRSRFTGASGEVWGGQVLGLYFDPTQSTSDFQIDYIRLTAEIPVNPDNSPPVVNISAPSFISGPDYATTELGNSWDMNNATDVEQLYFSKDVSYDNGILRATNTSNDPGIALNVPDTINTSKYRYLTYRMAVDGPLNTTDGSVARIIWWNEGPSFSTTSHDIVVYEGFRTVSFDLTQIKTEAAAGTNRSWLSSTPSTFRIDPHEFPSVRPYNLDYVMLTGNDVANQSFNIRYSTSDADNNTLTTNFFYFPDGQPGSTTPINCAAQSKLAEGNTKLFLPLVGGPAGAAAQPSGTACTWNTSAIPNGTYYVVVQSSDGTDTTTTTSQTPVVIQH